MGRVLKKLSAISLTFLVFATNMARVEDLVNDGTCHWICKTENGDIDGKELEEMISQGKLIKLAMVHQARVDETCANQTSNANHTSKFAEIWLKKMSDFSSRGIIESVSQAIVETIYSGRIFYGSFSYREMRVSCIFKSTTVPARNHSSRLALLTPHSVMYYVESLANGENDTFLTLMRVEGQTRIAVDSKGSARNSSVAAKNNELIVSDTWWFVSAVIWIGTFLYYPAILLLCRPSEVIVPLVRKIRDGRKGERLTKAIQPIGDNDDVNAKNIEDHAREHDENGLEDNDSPASRVDIPDSAGIMPGTQPSLDYDEDNSTHLSREVDTKESRNSELAMAVVRSSPYKKEDGLSYVRLPKHETEGKESSGVNVKAIARNEKPACVELAKTKAPNATSSTCAQPAFSPAQQVQPSENFDASGSASGLASTDKEVSSDGRKRQEPVFKSIAGAAVSANAEGAIPFERLGRVDQLTAEHNSDDGVVKAAQNQHSSTEEEEKTGPVKVANTADEHSGDDVVIEMPPQSDHSSTEEEQLRCANAADEQSSGNVAADYFSSEERQQIVSIKTDKNCACMVIVGGPSPVSIGSLIGNNVFSATNKTNFPKLKKVIKFALLTFFPLLLFTGFGDLLLLLLNLPNRCLTCSVVKVISNLHLAFIILAIVSFICYCLRYWCLFGSTSSNISGYITWKSCFVHRIPLLLWRDDHDNLAQECPKHLEVPENISHNLNELPDIFEKLGCLLKQCVFQCIETSQIALLAKVFFFLLPAAILCIFLSSPLVCLCHGRMRILDERFQNKFPGSHYVLPILEVLFIIFSLAWVAFYLSVCAFVMEIASISFITTLAHHPKEMLPHVTVVLLAFHYFWSCYSCFKVPYCGLIEKLFISYKKKFDQLEKNRGPNELINYKQGEYLKLIPRELFKYACKHKLMDIPVKKTIWKFLLKLGLPLLLFIFIFPVIQAPTTDFTVITVVIGFLTAYSRINDYINGVASDFSEEDVDEVVNDYIKKQL